jgi:predicted metal-dependent HD superfamily phosphohydrolase
VRFSRDRFESLWRELGLAPPPHDLFAALGDAYAEPHRAYHTARHIEECLGYVDLAHASAEIELALWFHDAIYDPQTGGNERRSAEWAVREIGETSALAKQIRELILITRHDTVPATPEEQLLVDIDLSILGASPERFEEYERQVRREYSWVPEPVFRSARAGILRHFLARPSVYSTDLFRELLERQARANLSGSVARLSA